jgi:Fe-S cluster assembly protein SufD
LNAALDASRQNFPASRGITGLLIHAFAHDVIERIRVAALRSRIEQILLTRLPQGDRIKELT